MTFQENTNARCATLQHELINRHAHDKLCCKHQNNELNGEVYLKWIAKIITKLHERILSLNSPKINSKFARKYFAFGELKFPHRCCSALKMCQHLIMCHCFMNSIQVRFSGFSHLMSKRVALFVVPEKEKFFV